MEDPYHRLPVVDRSNRYMGTGKRAPVAEPAASGYFLRPAARRPEPFLVTRIGRKIISSDYLTALVGIAILLAWLLASLFQ